MSERHAFRVRSGWRLAHNTELILAHDRVQLGDRELAAADVRWIRLSVVSSFVNGVQVGTRSSMELGNDRTSLPFLLHDVMHSSTGAHTFSEICSIALRFYGSLILRDFVETLAAGGSFGIGKLRFKQKGVDLPRKVFLVFSGDLQSVPWPRVKCRVEQGTVYLEDSSDGRIQSSESLWTPNACLIEPLVAHVRKVSATASGG